MVGTLVVVIIQIAALVSWFRWGIRRLGVNGLLRWVLTALVLLLVSLASRLLLL
jgi:hypothetical protein